MLYRTSIVIPSFPEVSRMSRSPVMVTLALAAVLSASPARPAIAHQTFQFHPKTNMLELQQEAARKAAGVRSADVYDVRAGEGPFRSGRVEYDGNGRQARTLTYYSYPDIVSPLVTEWDADDAYGEESGMRQFDGHGRLLSYNRNAYDARGLIISRTLREDWPDSRWRRYVVYTYDPSGRLTKKVRRTGTDPVEITRIEYDPKGRAILRSDAGEAGAGREIVTFDADGYEVRRETWLPGGKRPDTILDYAFDPSHRLLATRLRDSHEVEIGGSCYVYDGRNLLLERREWNAPSAYEFAEAMRYDRRGRLIGTDLRESGRRSSHWVSAHRLDASGLLVRSVETCSSLGVESIHTYRYHYRAASKR